MIKRPPSPSAIHTLWLPTLLICTAAWSQPAEPGQDAQAAESEVTLPAPAQKNNLLPFYVSATTTMDFAIDAKSLSVTPEGIVRYTLVITSKSGASNISYEGIRCATAEKKLYATGKTDGGWSPSRRNVWSAIWDTGANRQHAALLKDYFCDGTSVAGKAEAIVERMRRQKPLK